MDVPIARQMLARYVAIAAVGVLVGLVGVFALEVAIRDHGRCARLAERASLAERLRVEQGTLVRRARDVLATDNLVSRLELTNAEIRYDKTLRQLRGRSEGTQHAALLRDAAALRAATRHAIAGGGGVAALEPSLDVSRRLDGALAQRAALDQQSVGAWRDDLHSFVRRAQVTLAAICALAIALGVVAYRSSARRRPSSGDTVVLPDVPADDALTGAARELRKPLTSITSATLRLLDLCESDEPAVRELDRIAETADRMRMSIDRIVESSQLERGVVALNRTRFDTGPVVDDAIGRVETDAAARGVRVRRSPESTTVHADRDRILQALVNLLRRAVRDAEVGSDLSVGVRGAGDGVRFEVVDATPVVQATSKRDREAELFVYRRLVEAHRGQTGIDTSTAGTVYWFTVPNEPTVPR